MCCVCSAMNTKSVVPSFGLLNGLVSGGGDGMALPSDPVAAAKALGLVGEIFPALSSQPSLFFLMGSRGVIRLAVSENSPSDPGTNSLVGILAPTPDAFVIF